jgi:hypothetical protein
MDVKLHLSGPLSFMLLVLVRTASAQASPPQRWPEWPSSLDEPRQPEVQTVTRWYGWQTLIAAGLSDTLLVAGFIAGANELGDGRLSGGTLALAVTGYAGHALSGPIIHYAHGSSRRALLSFGMNLVLPTSGMWLGSALGKADERPGVGFVAGALAGVAVAQVVDISVLTYREAPLRPSEEDRVKWARSLTIAPLYRRDGAGLSIAGVF